jgi:hypothetical protein
VADLQSYNIVQQHRKKYHPAISDIAMEPFLFLFYPDDFDTFSRRYLGVSEMLKNITVSDDKDIWGIDISHYANREAGKLDWDELQFERIWLITTAWEFNGMLSLSAMSIKSYFIKNFKPVIFKDQDGVYVELYARPQKQGH